MAALAPDELVCDMAETYHVLDWRALGLPLAATLAGGLRETSRTCMALNHAPITTDTLLLGGALHWWWAAPLAVLLPGLAVGVVESTQARNKLSRNATFLLTIAALAALIFFVALLLHLNIDIR